VATVIVVLGLWFALAFALGAAGAFVQPTGQPPLRIFAAVMLPVVAFLVAYGVFRGFREVVLGADLPLITALQAWRFAGFGFLALYTHGVLPGSFAWPAGLGDIAIAFTAPWVALALVRRPGFAAGPLFLTWNLLGIADFVGAVSTATLSAILATGAPGEVTTAPMARMPLVIIPTFFVPLFTVLHLTAIFQGRRLATVGQTGGGPDRAAADARGPHAAFGGVAARSGGQPG
jgi:hypothetical protein